MSRLRLLHITLWGPNVPLSTVEFGPGLTLVRGPSDTGMSFMVEAIDFMREENQRWASSGIDELDRSGRLTLAREGAVSH